MANQKQNGQMQAIDILFTDIGFNHRFGHQDGTGNMTSIIAYNEFYILYFIGYYF